MRYEQDFEKILSEMSRAEKAQLLQWVTRDLGDAFPGIKSHPAETWLNFDVLGLLQVVSKSRSVAQITMVNR